MIERLADAVGTWVKIPAIESVQIMAHAGFDYVVIDLEHAMIDRRSAYELISMANALGLLSLVRVPDGTPALIQCVLDAGAGGILFPHIDDADAARLAVRSVRFPPGGTRGAGSTSRAGDWGQMPRADYVAYGNHRVLCIPQLESKAAYDHREDIAGVDGVDALFIGAADLAMDLGEAGDKATVDQMSADIRAAARAQDKPCGYAVGNVEAALAIRKAGFDFVMVSNDTSMLAGQAKTLVHELAD